VYSDAPDGLGHSEEGIKMTAQPAIVVLAAGNGRRFQGSGHKLAQPFYGTTVLGATLRNALATRLPVVVVVKPDLAELAAGHMALRDIVVLYDSDTTFDTVSGGFAHSSFEQSGFGNSTFGNSTFGHSTFGASSFGHSSFGALGGGPGGGMPGMGSSIAAGVEACSDADGWLIWPADMPLVRPETALAVAHALRSHPVAYAQYRGMRGHPVGFSSELFSELVRLKGDEGAKRLLARYPSVGLELPDRGILLDIDTEEDLRAASSG
jgi:molybdenum cofactor cytidylyltransferase